MPNTNRISIEKSVTYRAPINIALVKYWGKEDEELILPLHNSLSATLHLESLCTETTVSTGSDVKENEIWINGERRQFDGNRRLERCIETCMQLSGNNQSLKNLKFKIISKNNFPTEAGLASSASGFACITRCFLDLFGLEGSEKLALGTTAARRGSGSACRSMMGGYVEWRKAKDGCDSVAVQFKYENWWPEMRVLVLIVDRGEKEIKSSEGMARSVSTSVFLKSKTNCAVAEERQFRLKEAIEKKDFSRFAEITMKAAYSFDAGPNAFLFFKEKNMAELLNALEQRFGGFEIEDKLGLSVIEPKSQNGSPKENAKPPIKRAILTKVGPAPFKVKF